MAYKMATSFATSPTSLLVGTAAFVSKGRTASSSTVLGLPTVVKRGVRCCAKQEQSQHTMGKSIGMAASLIAVACAATMSSPAQALVDERMSTEGIGLSLGLSNNLLGWILLGVFGLIWSLYFVYTSTLEEDEDSGLAL
ncbi:hypothetical protein ACLOJK_032838 [Asimina triloba]